MATAAMELQASAPPPRASAPIELVLLGAGVALTLVVAAIFAFTLLRHGDRGTRSGRGDSRRDREVP